jgi:hypothetical protein
MRSMRERIGLKKRQIRPENREDEQRDQDDETERTQR